MSFPSARVGGFAAVGCVAFIVVCLGRTDEAQPAASILVAPSRRDDVANQPPTTPASEQTAMLVSARTTSTPTPPAAPIDCSVRVDTWHNREHREERPCPGQQLPVFTGHRDGVANATVIIEVGTNVSPETAAFRANYSSDVRHRWNRTFVLVDPLPAVVPALLSSPNADVVLRTAVSPTVGNTKFPNASVWSSLLEAQNAAAEASSNQSMVDVPMIPLEHILDSVARLPDGTPRRVELLVVDAQGFDLAVVLSAGAGWLRHVENVVIECQDVPENSTALLYAGGDTCASASRRLQAAPFNFQFEYCLGNVGPKELNCWFSNGKRRLASRRKHLPKHMMDVVNIVHSLLPNTPYHERDDAGAPTLLEIWKVLCPIKRPGFQALACPYGKFRWEDPARGSVQPRPARARKCAELQYRSHIMTSMLSDLPYRTKRESFLNTVEPLPAVLGKACRRG
jgi:FkbM family methyltransferase